MAKRFTDTEKWKDEWWGSLSNDYRMIWLYLVDSCSIAGIWKKDFRGLNFNCNTQVMEAEFIKVFSSRLIDRGNFFFIPKFLLFQYPKGLNSDKPAIVSVRKEIESNNLSLIITQSLPNGFLTVKDKDKDKDTGQEKGQGQSGIKIIGANSDVFLIVPSKYVGESSVRINGAGGLTEFYSLNMSIIQQPEYAGKFMAEKSGAHFKDFNHLHNSYLKFIKDDNIRNTKATASGVRPIIFGDKSYSGKL